MIGCSFPSARDRETSCTRRVSAGARRRGRRLFANWRVRAQAAERHAGANAVDLEQFAATTAAARYAGALPRYTSEHFTTRASTSISSSNSPARTASCRRARGPTTHDCSRRKLGIERTSAARPRPQTRSATSSTPMSCSSALVNPFTESLDPMKAYECLASAADRGDPGRGLPRARRLVDGRAAGIAGRRRHRVLAAKGAPPAVVGDSDMDERAEAFEAVLARAAATRRVWRSSFASSGGFSSGRSSVILESGRLTMVETRLAHDVLVRRIECRTLRNGSLTWQRRRRQLIGLARPRAVLAPAEHDLHLSRTADQLRTLLNKPPEAAGLAIPQDHHRKLQRQGCWLERRSSSASSHLEAGIFSTFLQQSPNLYKYARASLSSG